MNQTAQTLLTKIENRDALIGIIGLGYVGLPLALTFTENGFRVLGFDVDPEKVEKINNGQSYIEHLDPARLTRATSEPSDNDSSETATRQFKIQNSELRIPLSATSDFTRLSEPDAILICVPTPLTPQRDPDMTYVRKATYQIKQTLRPGQLVVLESTTYPGTTDELLKPILEGPDPRESDGRAGEQLKTKNSKLRTNDGELTTPNPQPTTQEGGAGDQFKIKNSELRIDQGRAGAPTTPNPQLTNQEGGEGEQFKIKNSKFKIQKGLACGQDFFLAFSPEREDPGNPTFGTSNIPKVVGGVDESSSRLADALYTAAVEKTVPVSSARVAEAAKLVENVYRGVNIALVNELKIVFDRMGIDIWEVLDAAETKPFGFKRFNPGPGWGGHCIGVDPFFLSWKARELGAPTKFIELAGELNIRMPEFVIDKLTIALNDRRKPVKGSKVLVLGLAYKPDIDDPRESPAFEVIDLLLRLGANVEYHDPHIPVAPRMRSWPDLPQMSSVDLTEDHLATTDAVLIVTNHKAVDYDLVANHAPLIIDTRGVYRDRNSKIIKA